MCIAYGKDCFLCGGKGHYRGAPNCKGKKKKPGKGRDGARRVAENSSIESSEESSGEEEEEVKRVGANVIHPAKFVSHTRRTSRRTKKKQQKSRYQVQILIKECLVTMVADTGADISVMSEDLAKEVAEYRAVGWRVAILWKGASTLLK